MAPSVPSSLTLQVPQPQTLRSQTSHSGTNVPVKASPDSKQSWPCNCDDVKFIGSGTDKLTQDGEEGEGGSKLLKSPWQAKHQCHKSSCGNADLEEALKKQNIENAGKDPAKKSKKKVPPIQKVSILYHQTLFVLSYLQYCKPVYYFSRCLESLKWWTSIEKCLTMMIIPDTWDLVAHTLWSIYSHTMRRNPVE